MRQFKTVDEAYDMCVAEGVIIPIHDVDYAILKASMHIVEEDLLNAQDAITKKRWNSAYKTYYDVLHQLAEAYLKLESIKIKTHLCLFAYLCVKHPELELNWNFFEKVRTKRNGIHYYAHPVTEEDWKDAALEFKLYINLFRRKLEEKIKKE
jgi:uncharacterized protein (UPF0332 family)